MLKRNGHALRLNLTVFVGLLMENNTAMVLATLVGLISLPLADSELGRSLRLVDPPRSSLAMPLRMPLRTAMLVTERFAGPAREGEAWNGRAGASEVRNSIGLNLVHIKAGTFVRGAPPRELGRLGDEELTETTLANDFYLAATEVTQAQYEQVMGANPSFFGKSGVNSNDLPVEQVSWHDAVEFCQRLSQFPAEQAAGRVYRLPSEAEWEFACRAGGKQAYHFGNHAGGLADYAWFAANSEDQTHPVGAKQPNAFGLFDMHGNVHEWCDDVYGGYSQAAAAFLRKNGSSPYASRVYRGGSWCSTAARCRAAWRGQQDPDHRAPFNGFRIAMNPPSRSD